MEVVPFFDFDYAEDVVDSELFEPGDGQRGGESGEEHVCIGEGGKNGGRDGTGIFPFKGMGVEVRGQEGATGFLPSEVGGSIVRGREAGEVGWLGEGDWAGHCAWGYEQGGMWEKNEQPGNSGALKRVGSGILNEQQLMHWNWEFIIRGSRVLS